MAQRQGYGHILIFLEKNIFSEISKKLFGLGVIFLTIYPFFTKPLWYILSICGFMQNPELQHVLSLPLLTNGKLHEMPMNTILNHLHGNMYNAVWFVIVKARKQLYLSS